jgi:hypothetical protein
MTPVFDPAEYSLDTVASLVAALVIFDGLLARLASCDAGPGPLVYRGVSEPVSIISSVSKEPFGL